ncbi:hypothetical protein GGI23_000863 [Coemansia sp. RSA 2559]|nr:hypothetical protein GGI23_000863 [Coemansia sp. RSA 2559]
MTRLNCVPGMIYTKIDSLRFRDFIDSLYTRYYPLSHSFRRWNSLVEFQNQKIFMAPYALVFAILCTDFALAHIPLGFQDRFRKSLQSAMDSGLYEEHRNKVRRLI